MLRTAIHDVFLHRSLVVRVRYVSTPSTSATPSSTAKDFPPILPQRKHKIDLHPAPKRIESASQPTPQPTPISSRKPVATSPSPPEPPKKEDDGVKMTIQRDIKHAEDLGILKPASPDATVFRKLIHSTWELTKFYFRGAKLIYARQGEIKAIKKRASSGGAPITRFEGRLIETQRRDINKVIPFLVIAVLLEEVIPIIAIYAPFMLPSTCLLPAQRERIEGKKALKALSTISSARPLFLALQAKSQDGKLPLTALREPGSATMVCSILRLPTFGIDLLRLWRIRRHLRFISNDDRLLIHDDVLKTLTKEDLYQAVAERGFVTQGLSLKDSQARLKWWLDSVKDSPPEDGVSRRLSLLMERR
ncbi:hypothetical protein E1B28_009936 [Marasmius oreades]|uniref:Letm1 RBD domain-containing protein n=1 Tax=Marasmius oreades TaxID=181124 RepID=A0A9P7RW48_9AGAR|nr:uncharacterized protein E1B28_009936 [Marasmius oreades]KAG7090854.1 hypothetical protein E1B28_009936 [Marasmius oreades]